MGERMGGKREGDEGEREERRCIRANCRERVRLAIRMAASVRCIKHAKNRT